MAKFLIEAEMNDRWVPFFTSFLKRLERNGNIGHSEMVGFYSDGDGDFRPKFKCYGADQTEKLAYKSEEMSIDYFDAG